MFGISQNPFSGISVRRICVSYLDKMSPSVDDPLSPTFSRCAFQFRTSPTDCLVKLVWDISCLVNSKFCSAPASSLFCACQSLPKFIHVLSLRRIHTIPQWSCRNCKQVWTYVRVICLASRYNTKFSPTHNPKTAFWWIRWRCTCTMRYSWSPPYHVNTLIRVDQVCTYSDCPKTVDQIFDLQ